MDAAVRYTQQTFRSQFARLIRQALEHAFQHSYTHLQ